MASGRDRTKHFMTRGEFYINPTDLDGTNGQGLGKTISGYEIEFGEQLIEDTDDEDGAEINQIFYAGNQVRIRAVLKTWDPLVLAELFPGQYDVAAERIEIPGTRAPGDSMLGESVVLVFVPDNPRLIAGGGKDDTLLAFKAIAQHPEGDNVPFANTEIRRVTIEFLCIKDKAILSADGRFNYRTMGIAPRDSLSLV